MFVLVEQEWNENFFSRSVSFGRSATTNPVAWDLYLKGRALTNPNAAEQRMAASLFEQAVAIDSGFVEAWQALTVALSRVYFNGNRGPPSPARGCR